MLFEPDSQKRLGEHIGGHFFCLTVNDNNIYRTLKSLVPSLVRRIAPWLFRSSCVTSFYLQSKSIRRLRIQTIPLPISLAEMHSASVEESATLVCFECLKCTVVVGKVLRFQGMTSDLSGPRPSLRLRKQPLVQLVHTFSRGSLWFFVALIYRSNLFRPTLCFPRVRGVPK